MDSFLFRHSGSKIAPQTHIRLPPSAPSLRGCFHPSLLISLPAKSAAHPASSATCLERTSAPQSAVDRYILTANHRHRPSGPCVHRCLGSLVVWIASGKLVVENDIQERTVNLQPTAAVIIDKAQLPEPVHEKTDPRPRCAYHLREGLLTHLGD